MKKQCLIKKNTWSTILKAVNLQSIILILVGVFATVTTQVITHHFTYTPPPQPEITISKQIMRKDPLQRTKFDDLNLDYQEDLDLNYLLLYIQNKGKVPSKNFQIKIYPRSQSIILDPENTEVTYDPTMLEESIVKSSSLTTERMFYRKLECLPIDTSVKIQIKTNLPIKADDIIDEFLCDLKHWKSAQSIIDGRRTNLYFNINNANAETYTITENKKQANLPSYTIIIGGYDPLILTYELIVLLKQKTLINDIQSEHLLKPYEIDITKSRTIFGHLNILQTNKDILDFLVLNKNISRNEADSILKSAKEAGGFVIQGYNIVILEAEILKTLQKKNYITLAEAQRTIDSSKTIETEPGWRDPNSK